jgi:hypothetical protein
MRIRRD